MPNATAVHGGLVVGEMGWLACERLQDWLQRPP